MTELNVDFKKLTGKPHLRGIHLIGFRGASQFGVSVPLRPLTVVYGPNSGGKSTILKALASIAQTKITNSQLKQKNYWSPQGLWFDLGSKLQILHRGKTKTKTFTLGFEFQDYSSRFPWVENGIRIARESDRLSSIKHVRVGSELSTEASYITSFKLPGKLPKNHYLLFSPTRSVGEPNSGGRGIPIIIGEDSEIDIEHIKRLKDYNGDLQYEKDSNVTIIGVKSMVRGDKNYLDVTYSVPDFGEEDSWGITEKEPTLWAFQFVPIKARIDLKFRPHKSSDKNDRSPFATMNKFDLIEIEYHEDREGDFHKILSLHEEKIWENDRQKKEKTIYTFKHHNAPSITDPGTENTEHEEWAEADLKTNVILAKLFLPLKYRMERVHESESDEDGGKRTILRCIPREAEHKASWRPSKFHQLVHTLTKKSPEDEENLDELIKGINGICDSFSLPNMSAREREAIGDFLNPVAKLNRKKGFTAENRLSRRKPLYQLTRFFASVQPQRLVFIPKTELGHRLMENLIERDVDGRKEWGNKSQFYQAFSVYSPSLMPYIEIDANLNVHSSELHGKWGTLPTNSRYHFIRIYWAVVQFIEEIAEHMSRVDYLSASRLSPQRIYQMLHVDTAGVKGERNIANLFGKFSKDKAKLESLNEKMENVVGMRVDFEELMGKYNQPTGLIDVRVGRPGKRKVSQLPDVGFGVSQTLPVLAALTNEEAGTQGTLLIIEEAESNLHPSAQGRLMKEILENLPTDRNGPSFVIETHSEHFLRTILSHLRDANGQLDDDVAIIYVDEDEEGMYAQHMETIAGEFIHPWPRPDRWTDPTGPII